MKCQNITCLCVCTFCWLNDLIWFVLQVTHSIQRKQLHCLKMVDSQYYLPNSICISKLDCKEAFGLLSSKEKLYAHYLSRAAWYGGLVVLLQTSPESPAIYVLLQKLFRKQTTAELEKVASEAGLSPEEYQVRTTTTSCILSNHSYLAVQEVKTNGHQ